MIMLGLRRIKLVLGSCRVSKGLRQWPSGQTGALIAGIVVFLLGSVALGTDVAVHYYNWVQLQKAADSGVLAGANWLPDDPTRAIATASQFAQSNGVTAAEISSTTVAGDSLSITMQVQRTVPYYFAQVLGMTSGLLKVSATAAPQAPTYSVGTSLPPGSTTSSTPPASCTHTGDCQLIPIGLDHNTVYSNGEAIALNQGQVGPGNWDLLALGGVGGNNLRGNIAQGYSGLVTVGDWVTTEPGKKVGPIDQGFQDRIDAANSSDPTGTYLSHSGTNPRVLVLPIVDWEHQNGRKLVQVDAFATVWLDSYSGGVVNVHFISQVVANSYGDPSAPNFGGRGHPMLIR